MRGSLPPVELRGSLPPVELRGSLPPIELRGSLPPWSFKLAVLVFGSSDSTLAMVMLLRGAFSFPPPSSGTTIMSSSSGGGGSIFLVRKPSIPNRPPAADAAASSAFFCMVSSASIARWSSASALAASISLSVMRSSSLTSASLSPLSCALLAAKSEPKFVLEVFHGDDDYLAARTIDDRPERFRGQLLLSLVDNSLGIVVKIIKNLAGKRRTLMNAIETKHYLLH